MRVIVKEAPNKKKYVKTIAITSGKGGVGKTSVAANLAIALKKLGRKVMLVDADLGRSNIDILLHLTPKHDIRHLLNGTMTLKEILVDGPHGVKILSAGSGFQELTSLDEIQRLKILEAFDSYEMDLDVLLIDTASGISENVAFFCIATQEIIVVTSPEPTAITGAYALIKVLFTCYGIKEFHVLVNAAKDAEEAFDVFRRLSVLSDPFLGVSLDYLGFLPFDDSVRVAVRAQKAFLDLYPEKGISKTIFEIARKFKGGSDKVKGSIQFFFAGLFLNSESKPR